MENQDMDIRYVAELARLEISDDQLPGLERDLRSIVAYIDKLKEVDVTGVEPTSRATMRSNVWREDEVMDSFPRDKMLANAPAVMNDCLIKVAQVLPGEGMN